MYFCDKNGAQMSKSDGGGVRAMSDAASSTCADFVQLAVARVFTVTHTVYVTRFLNQSLDVTTVCSAAAAAVVAMVREGLPRGSRCVRLMPGIQLTALNQRRYAGCHYGDVRTLSMTRTRRLDCLLSRHIARRPA